MENNEERREDYQVQEVNKVQELIIYVFLVEEYMAFD